MKKIWNVLLMIISFLAGAVIAGRFIGRVADENKKLADKHLHIMQLFNQWMITKYNKRDLSEYLYEQGYHHVAIYGMSFVGERLFDELRDTKVVVDYAIDKNAQGIFSDVPVVTPEDELGEVDCIIVTAIHFYDEIKEQLEQKVNCKILSLEDILHEI